MRQKLAPAHQGEDLFNCILSRKSFCFHYTKSYDLTIFRVEGDAFFDADLNCDDDEQEELPDELEKKGDQDNVNTSIDPEADDEFYDCLDCFDIDSEPSSELPYSVAKETDPARVVMDRLIREGKPSTESCFYR